MKPLDRRLLRYARTTRTYLAACVTLGLAVAGLLIAQATLLADMITGAFLDSRTLSELGTPMILLGAVIIGRALVTWTQQVAAYRSSAAVKAQLRSRLLEHTVRLGPGWLSEERSGELATLATQGTEALDGYFSRYLPQLVLACLVPAAVLIWVLEADLVAGVTIALTLPLIPIFMVLVGRAAQRKMDRQWGTLSLLAGHFLDVVAGLPTLKVFGRAAAQTQTINTITGDYARTTMSTLRVSFLSALVLELLSSLAVALVAVGVGLRLLAGGLGLSTALLVLILTPEAYWPLRQLGVHYHASAEGIAAAQRIFAVLETPGQQVGHRIDPPDVASSAVRVEEVTVTYPGRAEPALQGASLDLSPGEVVALVGPSGCGKSTLAALLVGFVRPDRGRVLVGERDLAELDLDIWRRQVAYLAQKPRLFAGTIADNVRLGAHQASDDAVRRALQAAGASFVEGLPAGIDTPLGERGSGLSAGQRQRIALARTFLRDAPLVVLDEPTSGLDVENEATVLDAMRQLVTGRTVLLVTHRPALLAIADRVVRLDRVVVA
ncbi:MAG TPA: thiol reductant ABC exporter subunit CydD [Pseudonocardiaceae bacterium]|nr:thiol reductant ABC exporter subunit CydD [Pseudonocardiaceae bacterium]